MVNKKGFRIQDSGFRRLLLGLALLLAPGTWRLVNKKGFRIQDSGFSDLEPGVRGRGSSSALALLCILFCSSLVPALRDHSSLLFAQQPQAQGGQPLYPVNAKYVNGVAPGFWPTAGSGLTLNLSAGTANCGGIVTYAGGMLTMAASATNYVYLNMSSSCTPGVNTTGFGSNIPIATVVTGASAITSITDMRTMFFSSVGVNGAAVPGGLPSTGTNGLGQIVPGSLLGNNSNVLDCTLPQFNSSGADFSVRVNACLAAVIAAGGGTADARGFPTSNTMSVSISVGSGSIPVTLLLPVGTITRASGVQFILYSVSRVRGCGQGEGGSPLPTVIASGSGDTSAVFASGTGSNPLYNPVVSDLVITGGGAGMIGIDLPTAIFGRFDNVTSQADVSVVIGGTPSCACYNIFTNCKVGGSYGYKFLATAIQNQVFGGSATGSITGIYIAANANKNDFYSVDTETGGSAASYDIFSNANSIYSPYLEATGAITLESGVASNYIVGTGSIPSVTDSSGNCTNFVMLTGGGGGNYGYAPCDLTGRNLYFGNDMSAGGNNQTERISPNGANGPGLDLYFVGYPISAYGHYGHAGLNVGLLGSTAGHADAGMVTIAQIPTPSAPTVTATGGTGTNYSYAVVCHDWNGGVTLPSSFTTVSGPASLSGTAYNTITPANVDGCQYYDVLKTNTSTSLRTGAGGNAPSYRDTGQATASYSPPSRNTTGDAIVAGEGCFGGNCLSYPLAAGWIPSQPYDVAMFYPGVPGNAQLLARVTFTRTVTFPPGLTASQGSSGEAATSSAVVTFYHNGGSFGTCTFAGGASTCTFASSSGATFSAGDVLTAVGPVTADTTLGDIALTIVGAR
jgi:hypothetical protein